MLNSLHIKNVAVIDETSIELGEGLNVLTGETGAGKSIIIDSINLILGDRSSRDIVRHGENRAVIRALFSDCAKDALELAQQEGADTDGGDIMLSREILDSGKSTAKISGISATTASLKAIGRLLVDIHGQHDSQALLSVPRHIEFLDSYGGTAIKEAKEKYEDIYLEYLRIKKVISDASKNESERIRQIDYLKYSVGEIEKCNFYAGEDDELCEEEKLLSNSHDIISSLAAAYSALYDGEYTAYDALSAASKELEKVSSFSQELSDISSQLSDILYKTGDIAASVRALRDRDDYNPERLNEVEERLMLISDMKRKYNVQDLDSLLETYEKMKSELEGLLGDGQDFDSLKIKLEDLHLQLQKKAALISSLRLKTADKMESAVLAELADLDMDKAKFEIHFEKSEEFLPGGNDIIEFMISTNPGEPVKPLVKIASGGELSRIMLALKTVLAGADKVQTLIFDEIDTGVSGRAAAKIAEKLYNISKSKQVICITHLAQIASMASNHYLIKKTISSDSTSTKVRLLNEAERKDELTRIISGNIKTDSASAYASDLLKNASEFKKK